MIPKYITEGKKPVKEGTDCYLILNVLRDFKEHHVLEIFLRCKPDAKNWAARSRISDLRDKGYDIRSRTAPDGQAIYKLIKDSRMLRNLEGEQMTFEEIRQNPT